MGGQSKSPWKFGGYLISASGTWCVKPLMLLFASLYTTKKLFTTSNVSPYSQDDGSGYRVKVENAVQAAHVQDAYEIKQVPRSSGSTRRRPCPCPSAPSSAVHGVVYICKP